MGAGHRRSEPVCVTAVLNFDNLACYERTLCGKKGFDVIPVNRSAAVESPHESFLITHAGVTAEFWATILGGPSTATEAALRINDLAKAGADMVFRAGTMLHGTTASDAGPLWADTSAWHSA